MRKICKSPFAFPLLDQNQAPSEESREIAKTLHSTELARREARSLPRGATPRPVCSRRDEAKLLSESRVGEHIANELRSIYEPIVSQPTPDRFIELLNRLEAGAIYEKARSRGD